MKDQSFHQQILEIFKDNPMNIYSSRDLINIQNNVYSKKLKKEILTMILTRIFRKNLVYRTPTQLIDGYYYSLKNKRVIEKIYQYHLLPYSFQNKEDLTKEITRQDFETLRTDENLNLNPIQNNWFVQKYGLEHFQKELTQQFLASLVGFCMCDGHIRNNFNSVAFFLRYKPDAEQFVTNFKKIFPKQHLSLRFGSGCYEVKISNSKFAKLLNLLGAPAGNKLKQPFSIPDWIYHGSDEIKRIFLSTIIGNEGSAPSNNRWRIQFVLSKCKGHIPNLLHFLNQIRTMLQHFDITTSHIQVRTQPRRHFYGRFYIKKKENIQKFFKGFQFLYASEKQEVLAALVQSVMTK